MDTACPTATAHPPGGKIPRLPTGLRGWSLPAAAPGVAVVAVAWTSGGEDITAVARATGVAIAAHFSTTGVITAVGMAGAAANLLGGEVPPSMAGPWGWSLPAAAAVVVVAEAAGTAVGEEGAAVARAIGVAVVLISMTEVTVMVDTGPTAVVRPPGREVPRPTTGCMG